MKKSLNNPSGMSYDDYYTRGAVTVKSVPLSGAGVPYGNYVVRDECQGVTKSGEACSARPVGGTHLCAGHTKQAKAKTNAAK